VSIKKNKNMALIIDFELYLKNLRKKRKKIRIVDGEIGMDLDIFIKKNLDRKEQKTFYSLIRDYKTRIAEARKKDENVVIKDVVNDYKQAENLLDDMLIYNYVQELQEEYKDKYFIWLPSTAKIPRTTHIKYYGNKFSIKKGADGKGLIPGMEFGCRCGMKILD
jgi:hypothetical protein